MCALLPQACFASLLRNTEQEDKSSVLGVVGFVRSRLPASRPWNYFGAKEATAKLSQGIVAMPRVDMPVCVYIRLNRPSVHFNFLPPPYFQLIF